MKFWLMNLLSKKFKGRWNETVGLPINGLFYPIENYTKMNKGANNKKCHHRHTWVFISVLQDG